MLKVFTFDQISQEQSFRFSLGFRPKLYQNKSHCAEYLGGGRWHSGSCLNEEATQVASLFSQANGKCLRRLTVDLGFEGLLAADINLNLLRLGFGLFGQQDFQHAIVIVRAHLPRIHGAG